MKSEDNFMLINKFGGINLLVSGPGNVHGCHVNDFVSK